MLLIKQEIGLIRHYMNLEMNIKSTYTKVVMI